MKMLSDDDRNLEEMSDEELAAAWDLWFDLAQSTNDADPPYTHGVFVNLTREDVAPLGEEVVERAALNRPVRALPGHAGSRDPGPR